MGEHMAYEWSIEGRVQMVMFRDFVQRKARKLGLLGYVKNNNDGSVTVVAEGEEGALATLHRYIQKGPFFAKVENVTKREIPLAGTYKSFEIVYG